MQKKQRRITLTGKELWKFGNELDKALEEGWLVVHECSFSESVSLQYLMKHDLSSPGMLELKGAYGIVFILEKPIEQ